MTWKHIRKVYDPKTRRESYVADMFDPDLTMVTVLSRLDEDATMGFAGDLEVRLLPAALTALMIDFAAICRFHTTPKKPMPTWHCDYCDSHNAGRECWRCGAPMPKRLEGTGATGLGSPLTLYHSTGHVTFNPMPGKVTT